MTAFTMDHLSQGRFRIGIGVSGPQVVEGWYGQPFPRRSREPEEWLDIFRQVIAREAPVQFQGRHYQLPLSGERGLGEPLEHHSPIAKEDSRLPRRRGPRNVKLAAELCEGWLPMFVSPYRMHIYDESLAARPDDFEIVASVTINTADDLAEALLPVKARWRSTSAAWAPGERTSTRTSWSASASGSRRPRPGSRFGGKRLEAVDAVPDELADEISLCGRWSEFASACRLEDEPGDDAVVMRTDDPARTSGGCASPDLVF